MSPKESPPSIVWFRQDLRLADNPALDAARRSGGLVIPAYIWSPEEEGSWPPGAASRWWLHHSLRSLDQELRDRGSRLILLRGPAAGALQELAARTKAGAIFWNRRYEPAALGQEETLLRAFAVAPNSDPGDEADRGNGLNGAGRIRRKGAGRTSRESAGTIGRETAGSTLRDSPGPAAPPIHAEGATGRICGEMMSGRNGEQEIRLQSFNASLLFEPWEVANKSGQPFQVFTPFWKSCLSRKPPAAPLTAPKEIASPPRMPAGLKLSELGLLPKVDWAAGLRESWTPGRAGALEQLRRFLQEALAGYPEGRNRPDQSGTSRLSPHLHHGEISPTEVWAAIRRHASTRRKAGNVRGAEEVLRQLGWRDFAHHLLFHFPHTPGQPLRPEFAAFPWRKDRPGLRAWQQGRTGFPFVDAGMRELWATGWMHNRVRMVVASFLVKDLLLPWQEGARWFWDTLVDADLANNTLGWQWTAGCGADAAPYFRIFNPMGQGEKFDPDGVYVRHWVPEIEDLPDKWIHRPFETPEEEARKADIELGREYPPPMVDHGAARLRALAALETISRKKSR